MTPHAPGSAAHPLGPVLRAWQDARTEAELLGTFALAHDDQAFAALVGRHGRLVWGVCRRILRHRQDAEDAFQATFFVLARRAGQIDRPELLANWLYGVAQRTARGLRKSLTRRTRHERLTPPMLPETPRADPPDDLLAVDEEVLRMPEYYRVPLVLCRLEGYTHAEVARILRCAPSVVSYRVTRGEELLRKRLLARGVVPAWASMAALLGQAWVAQAAPRGLLRDTVQRAQAFAQGVGSGGTAATVAQGVLRSMGGIRAAIGGVVLAAVVGLTGAGLGLMAQPPAPAPPTTAIRADAPPPVGGPRPDWYGDPLPPGAVARIGTLRFRPEQGGGSAEVAFAPYGKSVVSLQGPGVVYVWNAATDRERQRLPGPARGQGLAVSPDGRWLAVGGAEVQVWDRTAQPHRFAWKRAVGRTTWHLAFAPDGRTLACAGSQQVHVLDAETGDVRKTLEMPSGYQWRVAFAPTGGLWRRAKTTSSRSASPATCTTSTSATCRGGRRRW